MISMRIEHIARSGVASQVNTTAGQEEVKRGEATPQFTGRSCWATVESPDVKGDHVRAPSPPTDCEVEVLKRFLADPRRPAETFSYHEMRGFLFVVATAPTLLRPSEWLPVIFAGEEAGFSDLPEAEVIMGTIMGCYNQTVRASRLQERIPPAEVGLDGLDDESLRLWAIGFATGIQELEDEWDAAFESLTEDEFEHFSGVFGDLTVWVDPAARQAAQGLSDGELAKMLEDCRELFPDLLCWFAEIGLGIADERARDSRARPPAAPTVGRNDPCPCGSGKKYKRCCGIN